MGLHLSFIPYVVVVIYVEPTGAVFYVRRFLDERGRRLVARRRRFAAG